MDQLNQVSPIHLTKKLDDCIREEEAMDDSTENKLSNIRKHLKLPDNSTAARWAISMFSSLLDDQKSGNEIQMRGKDGLQYKVDFPTGKNTRTS